MREAAVGLAVIMATASLGFVPHSSADADRPTGSGVTAVVVERTEDAGTFAGIRFERLIGHVEGQVHRSEKVIGLRELLGERLFHPYRSEFEIIRPVEDESRRVAVVEVENRGSPIMLQFFNRFAIGFSGPPATTTYPVGMGDGFLFTERRSYARVQWQAGIAPDVPETAQGVGEVILRDFGRLLRSGRVPDGRSPLGDYRLLVLAGVSQSGWFVNTFVAEGFNADPRGRRVFDGALALAAAGNWLAINQLAGEGEPQQPYVRPEGRPLQAGRMLTRPQTDPFLVDMVTYTDFYRLRAGMVHESRLPTRSRRYALPAAHLPRFFVDDRLVFETLACNDKQVVPLSAVDYRPYLRALLVGLEGELGQSRARLPATRRFELGSEPPPSPYFNDLPDSDVPVPEVDADAQPKAGVRFPDVELPLGRLEPPAIPPVTTSGITAICGNFGGYQPFTAAELGRRYGDVDRYAKQAGAVLDALVRQRYLLPDDRDWVLTELRQRFHSAA